MSALLAVTWPWLLAAVLTLWVYGLVEDATTGQDDYPPGAGVAFALLLMLAAGCWIFAAVWTVYLR